MTIKNALAAVIAINFAVVALSGLPAAALGGEQPPLKGLFRDNFTLLTPAAPAPQTSFEDDTGRERRLGDFAGRVVLLNFWATWCAPCVRELPSLDRLQAKLGGADFTVVAVSWDRAGLPVVRPFLAQLDIEHLDIYLDPAGKTRAGFGVGGLPTTFLIDVAGRLVGGLEGPAEWDSPEAEALIRHYLEAVPSATEAAETGDG